MNAAVKLARSSECLITTIVGGSPSANSEQGIEFLRPELVVWALLLLMDGPPELLAVMDYLACAERQEEDVWLRDDIRIAWITCLYAGRDYPYPHIDATQKVLGLHPDKVWNAIVAKRLAKGFPISTTDGPSVLDREAWETLVLPRNPAPLGSSPKKPCRSVRFLHRKQA